MCERARHTAKLCFGFFFPLAAVLITKLSSDLKVACLFSKSVSCSKTVSTALVACNCFLHDDMPSLEPSLKSIDLIMRATTEINEERLSFFICSFPSSFFLNANIVSQFCYYWHIICTHPTVHVDSSLPHNSNYFHVCCQ